MKMIGHKTTVVDSNPATTDIKMNYFTLTKTNLCNLTNKKMYGKCIFFGQVQIENNGNKREQ